MNISNGCFYNEELLIPQKFPVDSYPVEDYKRLEQLPDLDVLLGTSFFGFKNLLKAGYKLYSIFEKKWSFNEAVESSFHFFVNTGYYLEDLSFLVDDSKIEMDKKYSELAVTDFDKALLGIILSIYRTVQSECKQDGVDYKELLYAALSLFIRGQSYQCKSGRALNINGRRKTWDHLLIPIWTYLPIDDPFFESRFDNIGKSAFRRLTADEEDKLISVLSYRSSLLERLKIVRDEEKEYVQDPQHIKEWNACVDYVNQLSRNEYRVIELLRTSSSPLQIVDAAKRYLEGIENTDVVVPGTDFTPSDLTDIISERYDHTVNYIWLQKQDGELVLLDKAMAVLVKRPYTFNTVIIAYRLFLLCRDEVSLLHLTKALEIYIHKNLSEVPQSLYDNEFDSYEDSIIRVSELIISYYNEHKASFESLSFDKIQTENTFSGDDFDNEIELHVYEEDRRRDVELGKIASGIQKEQVYSDWINKTIKRIIDTDGKILNSPFFISKCIKEYKKSFIPLFMERIPPAAEGRNNEIGRRMILSINAIYMLENIIDIILESDRFEIANIDRLKKQRKILYSLETILINKAYINSDILLVDDNSENMEEYRKRIGIDITEIEKSNVVSVSRELLDLMRRTISEIQNSKDAQSVIDVKTKFKESIISYPDADINDDVIAVVEQVSDRISEVLIRQNENTNDFISERNRICSVIGDRFSMLPNESLSSLTTAELLYNQYANERYAGEGFDYSSISALYYQSVETMYNILLWEPYANKLNRMKYKSDWFGYLYRNQNLPKEFLGYLPKEDTQFYLKKTFIKSMLTMGNFMNLLSCVCSADKEIPMFQEYMDKVFGYSSISKSSDEYSEYTRRINELHLQITAATPRRNNASHGVKCISKEECQIDRETVLYRVDSARNNALGIISLFLSLYRN